MSDLLTQAEETNKSLQNPDTELNEAKAGQVTEETSSTEPKKTDFEDFATTIFEKVSKPKFTGDFDNKEALWDKYQQRYETDYGEKGKEMFDAAYDKSAEYHKNLALEELEDEQLSVVLNDAAWIIPLEDETQRVDPTAKTTTLLETNSGRLQMLDWWTDAQNSVREASVDSKSYIDGNGNKVDMSDVESLHTLLDTTDETGKEIIGFQYDSGSEYERGTSTLQAVYRGENPTGELATVWDLKDSWLSNNGLTSNIAKTTVGSVMNFGMDVLDTAYTLAAATAGMFDEESDFYKDMREYSLRMQQYSMGKSDYDQANIFTTNNMLDMAINTGLQLLLAGGVSGAANSLSKMALSGAKKAAVAAGRKSAKVAAKELAEIAGKQYGAKAGLFLLGGMASKDAYNEALKAGFTEKEAGYIYFASFAAMFQANKLSNFTDDAFGMFASKKFGKSVAAALSKTMTEAVENNNVTGKGISKLANQIANGTAKNIKALYQKPGLVGAAFSEAMEEEAELVAQEIVNHMANMYSTNLGYKGDLDKPKFKSVMDEGYWEEKGYEALLSGLGGAMGGMMAHGARSFRLRGAANKSVPDDQWPVQGSANEDLRRLAFERARGTKKGKVATTEFLNTMEKERDNGRFGRQDYSTVWDNETARYKRMNELSAEEAKGVMSQSDTLYNAIMAQFDHYTGMYGAYAGSYAQVIEEHPEIKGVYGEEALYTEVNDLLKSKQSILSKSKAGTAPGVDSQLNAILDREDAILDNIIKRSEVEVDRFIASREQESAEAEESKDTKKKKAETLKDGQPEDTLEAKSKVEQAVDSKTEKLMMDEITRLAGALGISGGEMKSLLETQRRLKDIEAGKFVERGIINTLTNSNHFRKTIGPGAPKKYSQFGSIMEGIIAGDLNLKQRTNDRKADGVRFTDDFTDKLKGMPSDLEGIMQFIDSTDLPFLTVEQKQKMKLKIQKSVPPLEVLKMEIIAEQINTISAISQQQLGEPFIVIQDEGDTAEIMKRKVNLGIAALVDKLLYPHLDKSMKEVPSITRKAISDLVHISDMLSKVSASETTEDISRITFDPEETKLLLEDEFGDEIMVEDFLDNMQNGIPSQLLNTSSATKKVEVPQELKDVDRLIAKVDKAEDPLTLKEFEGEYFSKNINVTDTGLETIDQSLGDALNEIFSIKVFTDLAKKEVEGTINEAERDTLLRMQASIDQEGIQDLKQKIAIRKAQVEMIQRAFKITADIRGYNNELFVGGFDKSVNDHTFFSNYVNEMVGDPLRYFELANKKEQETITEEEAEELANMHRIIGDPTVEDVSDFDVIIAGLEELDTDADLILSMASNTSEMLKQNYYVSTINYLNKIKDSALDMFQDKLEEDEDALSMVDEIRNAAANLDVSATEEGSIAALKSIVKIKEILYELGKYELPSGRLVRDIIGYQTNYKLAMTSLFYNPSRFNVQLKEVLEIVGAGKEPADMKLPTVDQLIVAEQIAAHTTTSLNKYMRRTSSNLKLVEQLNVDVSTMVGLQGTGKTEIVAGLAASIAQKDLALKYGGGPTDHKILMSANTVKQTLKLHEAAERNGVHVGSVDGNKSLNQFDLYELLVNSSKGKSDVDHIANLKEKFEGIDMIIYDEASYIEFLEKNPESAKDLPDVGVLNAMLYQISKINDLRGKTEAKISVVLMGDKTQGGFMEGMKSPRNQDAEFSITGKGVQGAIGTGSIPSTTELTKQFRFEVASLAKDIQNFRETARPKTLKGKGIKVSFESSWNNISNDPGKLGGMKISPTWSKVCYDEETVNNIRKQLEEDPEFDVLIITNGGIDSIVSDSPLRALATEFADSHRVEVASMYEAQGSEASYSIVNVPANMLVTQTEQGLPDAAEVNIVSMAMGRAKFFTQLAIPGGAINIISSNEAEITRQSEPEVAVFRESWYRVLNEGLFSGDMEVQNDPESDIRDDVEDEVTKKEDKTEPSTDPNIIVDLTNENVQTPDEGDIERKKVNQELGIPDGTQSSIDTEKKRINDKLKEEELSDNERNDLESRINLLNNIDSKESDTDVEESLEEDFDSYGNRNSDEKLKLAENLGTIVFYSSRNRAKGATPNSIGTADQVRDTQRMFGSSMNAEQVGEHKLNAIGHNGKDKMKDYEYKLVTYQFNHKNGIGINTGLFAKPKNSPGEWFMASSSIESSMYEGEFGTWLRAEESTLREAYDKKNKDNVDITSPEYADLINLGNTSEIVLQKGTDEKNVLYAISRNIEDGLTDQLIQGTTAGSVETEPIELDTLAKTDSNMMDRAGEIFGSTGIDILAMKRGVALKNRLTTLEVIKRLNTEIKKKRPTDQVLKLDLFESIDDKKVFEITVGENSYPVVFVKTARGTIPFIKQAELWSPFLGISGNRILANDEVGINESKFYDAELSTISTSLDQILTDNNILTKESLGFGVDRMNNLVTSNLRVDPVLLESGRDDVAEAVINQFYRNLPPTLDKVRMPVKDAINLIKTTSGHVTFSKPMVVRKGRKAGHSLMFYSTRHDVDLAEMSSEELQAQYKTIAANRTPDESDVNELLGLNREGIGVIWLNQKGYNFSELSDIVENTSTTLSKNLYQLSTWGKANDNLVAMFTALAVTMEVHDESDRVKDLLAHYGDSLPLAQAEAWLADANKSNPAALKELNYLLAYMFSPRSMGRLSTHFTLNKHIDSLLAIQEESLEIASTKDMTAEDRVKFIEDELLAYINSPANEDADIPAVMKGFGLTVEGLAQVEIATHKGEFTKGELVRNKKTGKPVVHYDIIRYVPASVINALTGQDEEIAPEINLVNLFQRLDGADHKAEILGLLDSLLSKVPGMPDNIYASPFISLNSDSSIETGISPDNGDLTEQLTTNVKMVADPGVAMDASNIMQGFVFEDIRSEQSDDSSDQFEETKTKLLEDSRSLIDSLDKSEEPDHTSVISELKRMKRSYSADGDERLVLDGIIDNALKDVNSRYDEFKARQREKTVISPTETNLMEYLGLSVDSEEDLALYSELNQLDFIRENFLFDNASAESYVQALNNIDISKFVTNPARVMDLTIKKEAMVEGMFKSLQEFPLVPMSDSKINNRLAGLDLDNPTKISDDFVLILNPADNSLEDWRNHKTSRPSIVHLYHALSNGDLNEDVKTDIRSILKYGVGKQGKKIRMEIIGRLNAGKFNQEEHNALLKKLAETDGQEAANKFAQSQAVIDAFKVFNLGRKLTLLEEKINFLQVVYDELQTMSESERVEGLKELQSTLAVLFKNQENLPEKGKSLLESVENSLKSSIISESHHNGDLTTSQKMINIFENTKTYTGKGLSEEANRIFEEMRLEADKVPGLTLIQDYVANPSEGGKASYLKGIDEFKAYLRTKTNNRSVLREFNNLILESFCK
jgi:hypothetical protein